MTAEVALTLILLTGAGLMGRSFLALHAETNVIDAAGLTTMGIRLSSARYPTTEERRLFYGEVEDRLAAMREVEAFTLASVDPFGYGYARSLAVDGRPTDVDAEAPGVTYVTVGPEYFRTLGLPILRGRRFHATRRDRGTRERHRERAVRVDVLSRQRSHRPPDPVDEPETSSRRSCRG